MLGEHPLHEQRGGGGICPLRISSRASDMSFTPPGVAPKSPPP